MNRLMFGFVLLISILFAFNFNVAGFIGMIAVLWMIGGGLWYMIEGRLPDHFWSTVLALAIGPFFLASFFRALYANLWNQSNFPLGKVAWLIILLGLIVGASVYVRAKVAHGKHDNDKLHHANERKPVFPVQDHNGEE